MPDYHYKPYRDKVDERERRVVQTRIYRRNQAMGLLMIAAAILLWRLFHTHPGWVFPPGWWRP